MTEDLRYSHVLAFVLDHPWAITEPMLKTIAGIVGRRVAGHVATAADIDAALTNRKALPQPTGGSVAVIPVYGVLSPRANMLSAMSGGTSYEELIGQVKAAAADPKVSSILLDFDTPGGSVAGATEAARELMKIRATKPTIAVANFSCCSAGLWLASACTEIVASPSATVGSVGVLSMHQDISKALENEGIKRTYITSGRFKAEGNPTEPLSDDARASMQARVDAAGVNFHADISRGRGIAVSQVRSTFGEGRVFSADEALAVGMIDKIATFDDTLARLMKSPPALDHRAAHLDAAALDTLQEPVQATSQDRARDFDQRRNVALLTLTQ